MNIKIANFGPISNAELNVSKLTLLFGPNNCGKTYLSYAIWGLINNIVEETQYPLTTTEIKAFIKKGILTYNLNIESVDSMLKTCIEKYKKSINLLFNCSEDYFKKAEIYANKINFENKLSDEKKTIQLRFGKDNVFTITLGTEGSKNFAALTSENNSDDYKVPNKVFIEILQKIIAKAHVKPMFNRAFSITSERTGVTLFYKNLDYNKSDAIDYILKLKKNSDINPFTLINKISSRYAMPIQKNIDFVRDYENRSKRSSFILKEKDKYNAVLNSWAKVVGGTFVNQDDAILYKINDEENSVPLHLSSSATKSLFLIDAYLKHEMKQGDIVFIDEPELNLSPMNQVYIAQFLLELVKIGIGVFITTHSDYIVREINIFLQNDKFNSLKKEDISLYSFNPKNILSEINIDDDGFSISHFDDVISSQIERAIS